MTLLDSNRRQFLVTSSGAAAGLIIGFYLQPGGRMGWLAQAQAPAAPALPPPNAFLQVAPDDAMAYARRSAREEGVLVGVSSGASLAASSRSSAAMSQCG